MSRIIAVANQKGGVAKTTTVHTVGAALVEMGKRVLLVDLDPQACLTFALGIDPETVEPSLHDVMLGRVPAGKALVKMDHLHVLPSTIDLAGAEVHLLTRPGRERILAKALAPIKTNYDVVLIDCPPSLGTLTINGLTAADEVLIPLQCETLSRRGVGQLLETIEEVREYTNPRLQIGGVVATMFDGRANLSHRVLAEVHELYGLDVVGPPIPKSVRVAEAPGRGRSVLEHAGRSKSAVAYRELAAVIGAGL